MPNGIYPIFPLQIRQRSAPQAHAVRAGLGLRLRTWWRRDRLDEQIANGDDPRTSAELTLRAEQLGTAAERVRLAEHLEGVLRQAREQTPQIHRLVRRRQVEACADELVALAHRLRDDQPIDLRGAAMTAQLLSDPRGPLYYRRASVPLQEAVRSARLALDGVGPATAPAFRTAAWPPATEIAANHETESRSQGVALRVRVGPGMLSLAVSRRRWLRHTACLQWVALDKGVRFYRAHARDETSTSFDLMRGLGPARIVRREGATGEVEQERGGSAGRWAQGRPPAMRRSAVARRGRR